MRTGSKNARAAFAIGVFVFLHPAPCTYGFVMPPSRLAPPVKLDVGGGPSMMINRNEKRDQNDYESDDSTMFGFPKTVAAPLALLLVSQFLLFIGVGAVIPSIPLYGKEIGLSGAANGLVISAPAVAMVLLSKWGGNFADLARKPAMLYGMAIIAISDLGTAFATSLQTLALARLGLGAGRCISESGERGLLADLAAQAPESRGRALAAQQVVFALGIAIGAPLGGIVVQEYGPRASFLCVTAAAIVTLVLYLFLPETVPSSEKTNESTMTPSEPLLVPTEAIDSDQERDGSWATLLEEPQWRGLALCQCGASFGFAAKISSIPILATTLFGGAAGAGALVSAAGLTGIVGAPVGGWLIDKTGAKSTAIASGLVSAASLLLIPSALRVATEDMTVPFAENVISGNAALFASLVIAWSLGASAQGPALTALAQELAPTGSEATALALPKACGDSTYIFAPFILGLVSDNLASGTECAVAGFAIMLGAAALALTSKGEEVVSR